MIQQYIDLSTNATELRFCLLTGIGNEKFIFTAKTVLCISKLDAKVMKKHKRSSRNCSIFAKHNGQIVPGNLTIIPGAFIF